MSKQSKNLRGFSLIELIIVIGVITILSAAIFVAIDPVKRINASRNAVRRQNVEALAQGFVARLAAGRTIDGLDAEPGSWQMIGIGDNCDVDMCPGNDGIVSEYSLLLDGLVDRIYVPSFTLQSSFTFSAWVKFENMSENPILSTAESFNGDGFVLSLKGGKIVLSLSGGSNDVVIESAPVDPAEFMNDFHHIAFTYAGAGGAARLFLDGEEVASAESGIPALPSSAPLLFGATAKEGGGFTFLEGRMDDVRFFSSVIPDEAIVSLSLGMSYAENMTSYWPFENEANPLSDDASDFDATFSGEPVIDNGTNLDGIATALRGLGYALVKPECFGVSEESIGNMPQDPTAEEGDTRSFYIVNRVGGSIVVRACLAEGEGFGGAGNAPLVEAAR